MEGLQYKLCAGCKSMIPKSTKGWYCNDCKKKNRSNYTNQAKKVYDSNRWKKTRDKIRRENVFCEICMHFNKRKMATEVHHLVKIRAGLEETFYDENNLISICHEHHLLVENMTKEELIKALQDGSLI